MNYKAVHVCRSCGSENLKEVLSLGRHKIVDFTRKAVRVPLELIRCEACTLVQLRHNTNPSLLWNDGYGYRSGVNDKMVSHLHGIAKAAEEFLQDKDVVLDIGCNDGSLLNGYTKELYLMGIDPSENVASYAHETLKGKNYTIVYDFFNKKALEGYKFNVITAISMFYDLTDPNVFIEDIKSCLVDNGVFIVQQNYLDSMIKNCAFDNICHEHLEYYSLTSLSMLLMRHGMMVFRVEENDLNGGSIRTFICRIGDRPIEESVREMITRETTLNMDEFSEKVYKNIAQLEDLLGYIHFKGQSVYVYGASTRGGTLIQALGLRHGVIKYAVDRNPDKWGKTMESTRIPIISEEQARKDKPDYMMIMPYWFSDYFIERESEYLKNGGKFIIPLPTLRIV